uniref:Uncharacterized protein n=1 Tax=Lotharella oceanica TaxID=641309 RepID=A0A7S2TPM8_9EUKA|mmetsp:Transcript_24150/g.45167  ORF Transcript_24150/g.45167 Transcript_24150/m.45167 type:complete len:249 (+) Transcript_24150:476-1222(+)|eukprot:CAMPEP_0170173676 /NCGR_PEP_ID=MMETSP0040_2-20121228/6962_1 /TAXON_ID=641309 /ORGANISM="Lotharella oceanica, Strain CCMP622" /LENGTH=248 /DNA_ID=CAMNT_0010414979 /DNA_START=362 /DNA_END=1108 /DNA_ORIENTATION=+
MNQPQAPMNATKKHVWPASFSVEWTFQFVRDDDDAPDASGAYTPTTPFNVTTWRTVYDARRGGPDRQMTEIYDNYCIPVFGDPSSPMGSRNDFACQFLNVNQAAYVLSWKSGDPSRKTPPPPGIPACCIIGEPFHPPPRNFSHRMPVNWNARVEGGLSVDWSAVYDKDAGIFAYGFEDESSVPHAFYMKGVPWLASWMYQRFAHFQAGVEPPASFWDLLQSCAGATACPGVVAVNDDSRACMHVCMRT